MIVHLDFETFSEANIKDVGAYRYASDPSTEILIAAAAIDNGPPLAWVHPDHESDAVWTDEGVYEVFDAWLDPEVEVWAHNASFEHAVSHFRMLKDIGIEPPKLTQWRCSAVMCRKASIPFSLAKSTAYLGCGEQKDPEGDKLIKVFSILNSRTKKRTTGLDEPEKFAAFVDYCKQDVRSERDVGEWLKPFVMRGFYLDAFHFDLEMNMRGIPVDLKTLSHAQHLIDDYSRHLFERFEEITGLRPSQNVKVKQWFDDYGYPGSGMGVDQVEKALETLDDWCEEPEVAEALTIRQEVGFAAVNKVSKMLSVSDNRGLVRGCFFYNGAGTGRWSAKLIQPQNFKKPSEKLRKHTFDAYYALQQGAEADEISILFGNPLEVISSCIRHFMGYTDGRMVLSADYASIEARIVCWLAGQDDAVERFRNDVDSYLFMAEKIWPGQDPFGKESFERFVGKQAVLGCGYQMGGEKFQGTCAGYGQPISRGLADKTVEEFRRTYDKVAKLWGLCEKAARSAIMNPGIEYKAGPKLKFRVAKIAGRKFLIMALPSGRKLAYPDPAIEAGGKFGGDQITFYGQLFQKTTWGRISTYGGKLVENATQATAFDLMANGAVNASREGFNIFALIHDEALAECDPDDPREEEFTAALTDLPRWAHDVPLVAEAKVLPFYSK